MRSTRRTDIHHVDVGVLENVTMIIGNERNLELRCSLTRQVELRIGDGDDVAARVAAVPGKMGRPSPRAGAEYAHADPPFGRAWARMGARPHGRHAVGSIPGGSTTTSVGGSWRTP